MRATILLLGAVFAIAIAIATAREARCAGIGSRSHGALVLSVAAAGTRSAGTIATLRDFKALLGVPEVSHAVEAVLAGPQAAVGIARSSSALQLVLEPAYVKVGRSRHVALALSGRF